MKDVLSTDLQLFIRNMLPSCGSVLEQMRTYAEENHISIVDPEVGNLLNMMVNLLQPKYILEIGTAIGASTIYMATAMQTYQSTQGITTIELMPERSKIAVQNFKAAGVEKSIKTIIGDARELFPMFQDSYDLIFLDAAKGQYDEFLKIAYPLLNPNGLIIADNVLINGWVVDLNYPDRRKKTMVYRMKHFLESFQDREDYQCSLLPLGDGVALFRKKEKTND